MFLRRNVQILQQKRKGSQYIRNAQYIYFLPLIVGFFVAIFGLYFTSIQSSTVVLPSGNDIFLDIIIIFIKIVLKNKNWEFCLSVLPILKFYI